jgi:hypothetical protein
MQILEVEKRKYRVEKINLLPLKNLREIKVFGGRLEFSKREK